MRTTDHLDAPLQAAVEGGVVPGAVMEVGTRHGAEAVAARGATREGGEPVGPGTRYDLASLTKVVATLPSVLRLASNREIELEDRLGRYFSNAGWFQEPSLGDATVRELLTHSSGLPAWRPLFAQTNDRGVALAALLQSPLERPGRVVYSDLGFMLLGALVERVSGQRLDVFAREQVFAPLGMAATSFGPLRGVSVAATELCGWRGRLLQGEVHDENAFAFGGVAGHAGLFATAADLGRYARAWLALDPRLGREELLVAASSEQARSDEGAPRGLGWGLAWEGAFTGRGVPGYGHSGFSGTSLWIDPERGRYAVLLSNAVHPHRERRFGVQGLREEFHRAWAAQPAHS